VELTDGELVQRVQGGDAHAFNALVDRHYLPCLRFADRLVGNRADAEEAVQDTFVRAYRALGRYRDQQRFRSWLFRILVNRCRTQARRAERRFRVDRMEGERMARSTEDPRFEVDGELSPLLRSALASLPAVQREALLLKHVEELSYEEIAQITGARISALKMRVKRGLETLSQLMGSNHGT
jgi:RNA polymerase sigma-70 factor (ECF subfamily)